MEIQNTQNIQCNPEGGITMLELSPHAISSYSTEPYNQKDQGLAPGRHIIKWKLGSHCSQLILTKMTKTNIGEIRPLHECC